LQDRKRIAFPPYKPSNAAVVNLLSPAKQSLKLWNYSRQRQPNKCSLKATSPMGDDDHSVLQANIICLLLFLIATTAVVQHPSWFQ
jgi:hypothetical protein